MLSSRSLTLLTPLCFGAFPLCWNTSNCVSLPPSLPSPLHPPAAHPNFPGAFKARGMTSGLVVRSGAAAAVSYPETPAPQCIPFGSTPAPSFGTTSLTFGAAQAAPPCSGTGMVQSVSVGGSPQMGFNLTPHSRGEGTVQSGNLEGNPLADHFLGTQMGPSSFFGGNQQAGLVHLGGPTPYNGGVPLRPQLLSGSRLGETVNKNNNPFMF